MIIWLENLYCVVGLLHIAAATTAKSLQSCPTLCDPTDGNPSGSPVPGSLQARTLEWVAISFSKAWKWKVKGWTAAYQAPLSMGFSRQEYWSGVPSPSLCYTLIVYILKLFYHFLPKCLHESVIQKFRSSKKKSSNLSISYKKVLMKKKKSSWPDLHVSQFPATIYHATYSPVMFSQLLAGSILLHSSVSPLACPATAVRVLSYQW